MFFSLVPDGAAIDAEETAAGNAIFAKAREALGSRKRLRHPQLRAAAEMLGKNALDAAGEVLSEFLKRRPKDADAIFLTGECAMRADRLEEAEALFARGVALS